MCTEARWPGKASCSGGRAVCATLIRGSTLLEALIALLVLAVAVLGTVAGFLQALRGSHSALLQAQAHNLAADLAERIRANPRGGAGYAAAATGPDCTATDCGPAERAASDLRHWHSQVAAALPRTGRVARVSAADAAEVRFARGVHNPDRYRIRLRWVDPAAGNVALLELLVEVAA